jgi:hypothetical protein
MFEPWLGADPLSTGPSRISKWLAPWSSEEETSEWAIGEKQKRKKGSKMEVNSKECKGEGEDNVSKTRENIKG